jgi:maltose alpha-D-glucosyltransferase/alpha-amylase
VVIDRQDEAIRIVRAVVDLADAGRAIRCHGNLHLGQVLLAGEGVMFVDFEGEPGRPLYERLLKRSALLDVSTMIRSFQWAAHDALCQQSGRSPFGDVTGWLRAWQCRVSTVFLASYLEGIEGAGLLPSGTQDRQVLLHALLLERAYFELGFELNRERNRVGAPLADIPALLGQPNNVRRGGP